jgi:predicted lipid-binding transport protein (Tim44 family)
MTLVGGLGVGPVASLYFGGLAFVQHWVLRLLCTLGGYAPWRYARFLDYAAERIFLRKVGGSYIFVHRMLLEYFAGMEEDMQTVEEK